MTILAIGVSQTKEFVKTDRCLAWVFGIGLLMFGLHSSVFTLHNSEGETQFFPPMIGALILILVALMLYNEKRFTKESLGDKKIWIPLLIIIGSIAIRGLLTHSAESLGEIGIGVMLFGCYLVARELGKEIFYPLAIFVIIEIISVFIYAIWINPGKATGGLWSETNYDGATGVIIIGTMMLANIRWQWVLVIGMFIVGWFMASPECIFASAFLCTCFLIRRDYSKWLLIGVILMFSLAGLWYFIGYGDKQYDKKIEPAIEDAVTLRETDGKHMASWGEGRIPAYKDAIASTSITGHGFSLYDLKSDTGKATIHNVPLVIWHQIGPLAALTWLWVTLYCLIAKRWKYAILAIISMCFFDHYVWTTLAPYWWCVIGLVTACEIDDRIFNKQEVKQCQRYHTERASE